MNNKYEGEGKLFNKDGGLIYDDEFLNGKKDGYGKAYDEANHLKYEGEFKNGLKHGNGKEYDSKEYKLEYEGNFFEDKYVSMKEKEKYFMIVEKYFMKENLRMV